MTSPETTERALLPYEPTDLRGANVLVLATHPDDETLACGGSLALHREHGDPVCVVLVTSGEEGNWEGRVAPGDIRLVREAEAGRALAMLGIEEWELWRLPDRGVQADGELVERLVDVLARRRPTLVYAPAPTELHPDHRALARALRVAVRGLGWALRVAWCELAPPAPVTALVDVTPAWELKQRAIAAYASQLQGPHDYAAVAAGLGRYRALTLGREARFAEGFRVADAARLDGDPIWRWTALDRAGRPRESRPTVSVVVRTRDRPQRLREALDSLAVQTRHEIEVVVVNDGGYDVASMLGDFPTLTLRHVRLDERRGRGAAANAGVEAASAELIAYLDDDDVLHPEHLELVCSALERHTSFGAAYADVDVARFHWNPDVIDYELSSRRPEFAHDFDPDRLLYENYIPTCALAHRRELWERVGGFDPELELYEDWDFVVRLAAEVPFLRVPRRTAEYRIYAGGSLSTLRPWGGPDELRAREAIFRRHRQRFSPEAQLRVFHEVKCNTLAAEAEAASLRHRVAGLEGELARVRGAQEQSEPAAGGAAVAVEAQPPVSARPAADGAASSGPLDGNSARGRVAVRRVAGALRHPDRAARWMRTLAEDPRAGIDRLLGGH